MADNVTINITEIAEAVNFDIIAPVTAVSVATTENIEDVSINITPTSNLLEVDVQETPIAVTINVSEYDAQIVSAILLELEMTNSLLRFKEFTYNVSGDISNKSIYTNSTKSTKLYNVDYTYNVGGDLINTETTRVSDSFVFNKEFSYDINGNLISINII